MGEKVSPIKQTVVENVKIDETTEVGVEAVSEPAMCKPARKKRLRIIPKGSVSASVEEIVKTVETGKKKYVGAEQKGKRKAECINSEETETVNPRKRKGKVVVKKDVKKNIVIGQHNKQLRIRTTPRPLSTVLSDLTASHRECITQIGFGSLIGFGIDSLPSKLVYYVVDKFDPVGMTIKTSDGMIQVTKESVHEIFGIPLGGISISQLPEVDDQGMMMKIWKGQFDKREGDPVRPNDILPKLIHATDFGFLFKLNFLMLFTNTMGICESNGFCVYTVLKKITEDMDIRKLDWCEFIIDCLKLVKKPSINGFWVGPVTFLTLLYLDRTKFDHLLVARQRPAFKPWKTSLLKERETLEIDKGGLGNVHLRNSDEGFLAVAKKHISSANEEYFKIEDYFSTITETKEALEYALDSCQHKCPNEEKVEEFFERFHGLFKQKGSVKHNEVADDSKLFQASTGCPKSTS